MASRFIWDVIPKGEIVPHPVTSLEEPNAEAFVRSAMESVNDLSKSPGGSNCELIRAIASPFERSNVDPETTNRYSSPNLSTD